LLLIITNICFFYCFITLLIIENILF